MQKHFLKFGKVFTNVTFSPLFLILNNSELAAKYLPNEVDQSLKTLEIPNINNFLFQGIEIKKEKQFLLAENNNDINEESVLISEIIIEGWENHPEGRKLELAAYDSMSIKPGSIVDNQILNQDLNAIYASGWFSGVKIKSQDGPLGVRLIVNVVPNPILKKVELKPTNSIVSNEYVDNIFKNYYGTTLNLNEFQKKIKMNSDLTSFDKIEQKIGGSRKISNYIIGGMLTIGGIGFLLASISSYTGKDLLPLGNPSTLLFIPQGIIMGAYGVIANLLNFYLWYLVYINFGSGSNYFDKSSKSVEIKRKGLFKDIEVKLNFDEIKSVKLDISEGFNPRRRIALVLKGRKKPLPLSGAGELKPLLQVEEEGARLAKFLDVNLEGLK